MSVCLTFESYQNYSGTEFRGAVSTLEKNIQICARVFTFSVKLEKWSFHVADLPRTWKKCTELRKHVKGVQNFCFCQLSMQILWRRRCSRVVDLKLPNVWNERTSSLMEVVGSIPNWNNEMFFVVPSPVAKQPSLQHSGYLHDMTMSALRLNASIILSYEGYQSTATKSIISEKRSRGYLLDSTRELCERDHYLG